MTDEREPEPAGKPDDAAALLAYMKAKDEERKAAEYAAALSKHRHKDNMITGGCLSFLFAGVGMFLFPPLALVAAVGLVCYIVAICTNALKPTPPVDGSKDKP